MLVVRARWLLAALVCLWSGTVGAQADLALSGSVSEPTGSARFALPLELPAGAAGHTPALALVYDSAQAQGVAGWLGLGWQLDGLGAIERDRRHGPPFDVDGPRCGSAFCYRADFALDGVELVRDAAPDAAGAVRYRTRSDDGRRIEFLGAETGWEIRDRTGRRLLYGPSAASRVVAAGRNGEVFAWLLARVEDAHGNWIEYRYTPGIGLRHPAEIVWGQAGAGANRSVRFLLNDPVADPRPDRAIRYDAGFRREQDRRLLAIEVRGANDALVTRYRLTYAEAPDSGRSLLVAVQREGADGATTWPRPYAFRYSTSARAFAASAVSYSPEGTSAGLYVTFWDGDRLRVLSHDLDGDGLRDLLYRDGTDGWRWYRSRGDRLARSAVWDAGNPDYLMSSSAPLRCSVTGDLLVDLDADGFLDQVFLPWSRWHVRRGTAQGFDTPPREASYALDVPPAVTGGCAWPHEYLPVVGLTDGGAPLETTTVLLDLDGNGRPDRIQTPELSEVTGSGLPWRVWLNRADPRTGEVRFATEPLAWHDPAGLPFVHGLDPSYLVFDVNGDGLADRVWRSGSAARWQVAYNWGGGFEEWSEPLAGPDLPPRVVQWHDGSESPALADLNGDGLVDRVERQPEPGRLSGPWRVWFGTGDGFRSLPATWSGLAAGADWGLIRSPGDLGTKEDLADWNGDGLPDKVVHTAEIHLNRGPFADRLEQVTNPLGGTTRFTYASSAGLRDASGEPANPGLRRPRVVVTRIAWSAGRPDAPEIVDVLDYRAGRFDTRARAFRGFGEVSRLRLETDDPNDPGSERRSHYRTDGACVRRLSLRETHRAGVVYRRERHDYRVVAGAPAGNAVADPWEACLLEASTFEAIEGDEAGRKSLQRRFLYAESDPEGRFHPEAIEEWTLADPDAALTGPRLERVTRFAYAEPVEPGHHVVSHPATIRVLDGADPNRLLAARRFRYDGLPDGAIERGRVSAVQAWLAHPPADPVQEPARWVTLAEIDYDASGQPIRFRGAPTRDDPDGFETSLAWDPVYATFLVALVEGSDTDTPLATTLSYEGCGVGLEPPPALGLPCTVTRGFDPPLRLGYDALGRLRRREHPSGLIETHRPVFSPAGEPSLVRVETWLDLETPAPARLHSARFLDGLGRVFREDAPGAAGETIRVVRHFDRRGRLARETLPHVVDPNAPDPGALFRSFAYDPLGRRARVRDYDGATQRRWSYAPWQVTEEVFFEEPAPGVPWQRRRSGRFDALGRLVEVSDQQTVALALRVRLAYDPLGRLIEIADPLATDRVQCRTWKQHYGWQSPEGEPICGPAGVYPSTRVTYDTLGRTVRVESPDSGTRSYAYDDAGLLQRRTTEAEGAALASLAFTYDELQRRTEQRVWPAGAGAGDAVFVWGTTEGASTYGRLVAVSDPTTRYEYRYDESGRLARQRQTTAGLQFDHEYRHDELDRLVGHVFPDGSDFVYHWDGVRLARIFATDRAFVGGFTGWLLNRARYDALGRPTRLELGDYAEASGSDAPVVRIERAYDPDTGRLSELTAWRSPYEPWVLHERYAFDGLGRLLRRTGHDRLFDEPLDEAFAYDALGRLVRATGRWERAAGNPEPVTWSFAYDPLGNLQRQQSANPDPATARERTWHYADFRQPRFLSQLRIRSGTELVEQRITGDAAGRVLERRAGAEASAFRWGPGDRPWQLGSAGHRVEHDPFGDRVLERFDDTTRVHAGGEFDYDVALGQANKELALGGEPVATLATHYAPAASAGLAVAWREHASVLAFAGLGLALVASLVALLVAPSRILWLALPGLGLLIGAVLLLPLRARSGGGWVGGPSPHGRHGERLLLYLSDHLGSTRAVVDGWGTVVEARAYDPLGQTTRRRGDFALQRGFAGGRWEETAGVYTFGARPYDPDWGRFLSPDAFLGSLDSQGLNRYAYARNRPTSLVDPSGDFVGVPVGGVVIFSTDMALGFDSLELPTSPFCCWTERLTALDRDGDGRDDARAIGAGVLAALRLPPLAPSAFRVEPRVVSVLDWLGRDLAAFLVGLYGNARGIAGGLGQAAAGAGRLDLPTLAGGLRQIFSSLVPRHGWYGGPEWGVGTSRVGPLSPLDEAFRVHDEAYQRALEWNGGERAAVTRAADWQLVRDVWAPARPQPGPTGQLYRLGVTLVFPLKATLGL